MKHFKYFAVLCFFSSVVLHGQNLTVDQTTYTVEQLIRDVLINSVCAQVSNISFSTGSNTYGDDNGIGYFSAHTGAFPFAEGLIMASGNALISDGPNNQNNAGSGNPPWLGDSELDMLSGSNTFNATII